MASGNDTANNGAAAQGGGSHDMTTAQATYDGLMSLMKYSIPVIAAIVATVIYLLSH